MANSKENGKETVVPQQAKIFNLFLTSCSLSKRILTNVINMISDEYMVFPYVFELITIVMTKTYL